MKQLCLSVILMLIVVGCGKKNEEVRLSMFKDDVQFLNQHVNVVLLADSTRQAQVAICPQYQGRVMTSTASGDEGISFGWINRDLIASGENNPHINAFGGEDRFWLGPEGGQFSIFFKQGDPFDLQHWFTPPAINEEAYDMVMQSDEAVLFRKTMRLVNYSGATFDLEVNRAVRLLSQELVKQVMGLEVPEKVKMVAFQSDNRITNLGQNAWEKDTGALSIWILGMFNPSPKTTIVIPFKKGFEDELGPVVNDAYFGKVPEDRLAIRDEVLFFKGDGQHRSKIGISQRRAKPIMGSYDAKNKILTLVHCQIPQEEMPYVNSMWELQNNPYSGDALNSYNDGPPAPGQKPLGPFYELESSSPAAFLRPTETMGHMHSTTHFIGDPDDLDVLAQAALGVTLKEIENAFEK